MKKFVAWGMALLMAGALAGCGSTESAGTAATAAGAAAPAAAASGDAFTLGLICPLSGSSAVSGQILKNATEMAVNEINAAGGINGEIQIVLAEVDDEGVPATSVTAMQKLVEQDKVNAVIGAQASSCTLANMEITKAAKIPQITP
ncbi:MAG: ABC transporter substrate-binding protein, partial [Lachnospiraceae bacterium]|nr:ABC transporter substrate-binding protein [Lachnospiraceae bacterium]